jgi:exosortase A
MTTTQKNSVISVILSKPFFGICLLFTFVSLLNIPVLMTLWKHSFDDGTYSHAFLIPFISLYLYYLLAERGKLQFRKKLAVAPSLLFIASCYLLFVTTNAQISLGYWGALLAIFISSVVMLYRFNWYSIFPATYLVFIFPFWGGLIPLLQNISVAAVTYMMSFTGVPTYVEAEIITIPAGAFQIADGCSGLRYIIVSLAISSLFIFLNIKETKKAVLFLSLAILGALLTNWIRITALILIGEYTNMESSLMEDHNTFGWYLYVPFMVLLFYWGNKLSHFTLPEPKQGNFFESPSSNKLTILVLIVATAVSSTTLSLPIFNSTHLNLVKNETSVNISPNVFHYSSVLNMTIPNSNTDITYAIYSYNGELLSGKPSYFGNNLIPEGWSIQKKSREKNWLIYHVFQKNNKALIFVKYEISNETSTQIGEFKFNRMVKALSGQNQTKLHWAFTRCKLNCTNTKTTVITKLSLIKAKPS